MYPPPYARLARDCGIAARRHHYGPGPDRWADLRLPPGPGPHPVAVLLHGGFWRMPWGADLMHALAGDLCGRGWATWNVEYRRLGAPGGGWPGTLEDAAAARLGLGGGAAAELLGGTPEQVPDRYRMASPRERLPLGAPQLLVHGELDDRVPVAMSCDHAAAAGAAGDRVELAVIPGTGHPEVIDPAGRAWQVVVAWLGGELGPGPGR